MRSPCASGPVAAARTRRRSRVALVLLVLSLSACAGLPWIGEAPVSEEEREAYDTAQALRERDPAAARQALLAFVEKWPESPLADDATYALGELAQREGDDGTALVHYARLVRLYPNGDRVDAARVRVAELEAARGDAAAARSVLGRVRYSRLSDEDRRAAYRVLARVAPDPVARLRWLTRLREEEPDPAAVDRIDLQIDGILVGLDAEALARAAGQITEGATAARLELARAERALDDGDLEAARDHLERLESLPLGPRYAPLLAAVTERLLLREQGPSDASELPSFAEAMRRGPPETASASGTLGVVLPLSGPFARFGEESLHGVLLATGVFDASRAPRPDVRVLVRDTAGNPARAAEAVRELASDELVSAIVGPLLGAECEAAAAVAEELGVPLLTLSAREEVATAGLNVFRLRTRPVEDAQVLVDRAMREFDARRFAILYRDDPYGSGLRGLFWDAVERRGGRVVGVASYDPQATDFAEPIRRLVGYELLTEEERSRLAEREQMLQRARRVSDEEALELRQRARELTTAEGDPLPPIVDFEALFIPESHENMLLIAPQLAFHEALDTRLLGPDGWFHEDLLRLAGQHVEGARFTAHFHRGSEIPFVRDFSDRFEATFERAPGVFAAEAYDAANLVLVQLARGRHSRGAVRDGVLATEAFPGVSGVMSMRADGNAQKRPFLLGVERGRVVEFEDDGEDDGEDERDGDRAE